MHILRGYVRCPWCRVVGPPASVTLAVGDQSRRVRCVACGEWHLVADVTADRLELSEVYRFPNAAVQVGDRLLWDVLALHRGSHLIDRQAVRVQPIGI